jgi:sugar phosphate isomerase/epimerase
MIFNYNQGFDQDLNDDTFFRPKNVIEGGPLPPAIEPNPGAIEEPILPVGQIGSSVTEGNRFGTFVQSMQQAIRKGVGRLELAAGMGGGHEPVGVENYGKEARQEIREIAKANEVTIHSIHAPSNIGNMSGYNPQERGFNEEHRKTQIEEVKKAIDFAGDVTQGSSVVVHTGEYLRDMTSSLWNKKIDENDYEFQSYEEEPERQVLYMVDDRTGKLITEVRKSQVIREPKFKKAWNPAVGREMWIDEDDNFVDDHNPEQLFKRVAVWDDTKQQFQSETLTWNDFEKRAEEWNKFYPRYKKDYVTGKPILDPKTGHPQLDLWTPEEAFFKSQMDTRILQARGSSLYHGRSYEEESHDLEELKKALTFFESIERNTPVDEQWKLLKQVPGLKSHYARSSGDAFVPSKNKMPTELIKDAINSVKLQMRYVHEASSSADAQADDTYETLLHVKPIEKYAKEQTSKSYAELGIHAMDRTKEKKLPKPIFVAPENIFPEMGYGSHPEELIELVQDARKTMANFLSEEKIRDPKMGWEKERDPKTGLPRPKEVKNPYYRGISKKEAEKIAEQHIKATLDTQHLGMWWKNFQPLQGETVDQRKKRFDKWYMEQTKKLADSGIIGNVHLVDGMGGGHHHLPAGQGDLPVVDALKLLLKKGYEGNVTSEGHGEGQFGEARQMTKVWEALGNRIHSGYWAGGGPGFEHLGAGARWGDVHQSYFGQNQPPYFVFGNYSPSNDWSLWSQVPME